MHVRSRVHTPDRRPRNAFRFARGRAIACARVIIVLGPAVDLLHAQATRYWDPDGTGTANGGSGIWNTTSLFWTPSASSSSHQAWSNGSGTASFTDGSSATLGTDITAGQIVGNNLTFALGGFNLTLSGTGSTSLTTSSLSGSGKLIKSGTGTLTLGSINDHQSGTEILGGTLIASADRALGTVASPLMLHGGTLRLGASFTLDDTRLVTLANTATIDTNGFNLTRSAAITGNGTLVKTGAGTLSLTGTNTFTGGLQVDAGTLQLGNSGTVLADTAFLIVNAGTVQLSGQETVATLSGSGGMIDLTGGALTLGNVTGTATYAGVIQGASGTVTKAGTGTLVLTGTNTANGTTFVSAGTLQLGNGGTSGSIGGDVQVSSGAQVVFNRSDSITYAGTVSGAGALAQAGPGTLILSGIHTYTGATTISAGELRLTGSASNSAFTVSGGTLSGTGTLGDLTVASGGRISPGLSPGTLQTGDTTFSGGGSFLWEINHATGTPGQDPGWDLLSISGSLTLTANASNRFTLSLTSLTTGNVAGLASNFDSNANYSFTFVTTTAGLSGFSADAFTIDTTGFQNPFSGTWSIAQSGNSLTLNYSAVPEPSEYAACAGAIALVVALRRRRRGHVLPRKASS